MSTAEERTDEKAASPPARPEAERLKIETTPRKPYSGF